MRWLVGSFVDDVERIIERPARQFSARVAHEFRRRLVGRPNAALGVRGNKGVTDASESNIKQITGFLCLTNELFTAGGGPVNRNSSKNQEQEKDESTQRGL